MEVILDTSIDVTEPSKSIAMISGINSDTGKTSCLMSTESRKEMGRDISIESTPISGKHNSLPGFETIFR